MLVVAAVAVAVLECEPRESAARKGHGSALGHLSSPLACRGRGRKPDIARLDITALPDVAASLFGLLLNCAILARRIFRPVKHALIPAARS